MKKINEASLSKLTVKSNKYLKTTDKTLITYREASHLMVEIMF